MIDEFPIYRAGRVPLVGLYPTNPGSANECEVLIERYRKQNC